MNIDAQEAVLGLLSMGSAHTFDQDEQRQLHSHSNTHLHHHGHHHTASSPAASSSRITPAVTSSATLNSILTTTTSPLVSSSTSPRFDSVLSTITTSTTTIPTKRKQRDVSFFEDIAGAERRVFHPHPHHFENDHSASSFHSYEGHLSPPLPPPPPLRRVTPALPTVPAPSETIDCMCGYTIDNGFSVACDLCSRWCHGVCFGLTNNDETQKIDFWCWRCEPRSTQEREGARRSMEERLTAMGFVAAGPAVDGEEEVVSGGPSGKRRKASPGTERKRRASTAAAVGDGGKRKRRPSVLRPQTPVVPVLNGMNSGNDDEHVDIDEPWTQSYVHVAQDIVPNDETRTKLRRHAQHWRGVTAVTPSPTPAPIAVKELPPSSTHNPLLISSSNPDVLPPAYGVHATQPIPSNNLITRYLSRITPSASYLADPLNSYAHLGMPKPFVHLMGPPLGLALDARQVGNEGRFVRSGCRPNAVLRPVLCDKAVEKKKKAAVGKEKENMALGNESEKDEATLGFGVFALRDLKVGEEVVLGWEWDDGNAVHRLPALLQTPHMFPTPSPSLSSSSSSSSIAPTTSPHELNHLRNQMANILHALSSTFTTCACGARARDCALTQMAAFVDGQEHFLHIPEYTEERLSENQPYTTSGRMRKGKDVDLGPLVGSVRGFRTKEKLPMSGGMGGMMMCDDDDGDQVPVVSVRGPSPQKPNGKGKERALEDDVDMLDVDEGRGRLKEAKGPRNPSKSPLSNTYIPPSPASSPRPRRALPTSRTQLSSELRPPDPLSTSENKKDGLPPKIGEDRMPPKMRKRWMHRELEAMKEVGSSDQGGEKGGPVGLGIRLQDTSRLDKQHPMPPPPSVPVTSSTPTTSSTVAAPSVSPLNSFAHLSLLSPAFAHSPQPLFRDEVSSPRARPRAKDEHSSTSEDPSSPSASEKWSPLRRTLGVVPRAVSPTPLSSLQAGDTGKVQINSKASHAWTHMDNRTMLAPTPVEAGAVPSSDGSEVVATSEEGSEEREEMSKEVEGGASEEVDKPSPPLTMGSSGHTPTSNDSASNVSDSLSTADHPMDRTPTPTISTPLAVEAVIPEYPPASALFDDELLGNTTNIDVIEAQLPKLAGVTPNIEPEPEPASLADETPRDTTGEDVQMPLIDAESLALTRAIPDKQPKPKPVSPSSPSLERGKRAPRPPSPPSPLQERKMSLIPPPHSPPAPWSPVVERISERATIPVPLTTAEPAARSEAEAPPEPQQAPAPQKVKLSLQAWKRKKQAEKQEQQQAGRAEGHETIAANTNGGGSMQASPMSVNSALVGGEEHQGGGMEVESKKDEIRDVEMAPPISPSTTAVASIAVAKLELNGCHTPPLLLPQTRETKTELIERPLSGLSGLKHLISTPIAARTAHVFERSVSPMGPDLAFNRSHSHSPSEGYVPLQSPPNIPTHEDKNSSARHLAQEDGEIRDTSLNLSQPSATTNSSLKPASLPAPAPPLVTPSTEPPALLPLRPNVLHPHSMARLPPRPAVTVPPPLPSRGTPPGQGRWTLPGGTASPLAKAQQPISPSVPMLTPSTTLPRTKPPTAPRSMNIATRPPTPPQPSSLSLNCVASKPIHKSPPKGPRALMESWTGPKNVAPPSVPPSASSIVPTPTSSFPIPTPSGIVSSLLSSPKQYIPRGPSATRDLERWPNTTRELDRYVDTGGRDREREREKERERERDRNRDRDRDRDRDDRERCGNRERDRDRDYDQRHYRGMRRAGYR